MTGTDGAGLAQRLLAAGPYRLLYGQGGEDAQRIWEEGGEDGLREVALDEAAADEARFLAAEVLAERAPDWVPAGEEGAVADVYVKALRAQVGGANPWGLPGEVGVAGEHLLRLGEAAVEALRRLLEDETPVQYAGSREVGLGRRLGWRVKDVAATLLRPADAAALAAAPPKRRDELVAAIRGGDDD